MPTKSKYAIIIKYQKDRSGVEMRVLPLMFNKNIKINNKTNNSNTQLKGINTVNTTTPHNYTGNASIDLAYASMIDESIANDLKKMNLIG